MDTRELYMCSVEMTPPYSLQKGDLLHVFTSILTAVLSTDHNFLPLVKAKRAGASYA